MLKVVGQVLHELGLVATDDAPLRCYINITTGDSLAVSAWVDEARFFQIKASEHVDLAPLYARYCRAWRDLPEVVPRPLGQCDRRGWSVMVTEGVGHKVPAAWQLLRPLWYGASPLERSLRRYFATGPKAQTGAASAAHASLLDELTGHFATSALAGLASRCIAQARELGIETLPEWPQHGDFVLNNLGWSHGRLVVFDWEDYDKVRLPGFDLFTLCLSLFEEDPAALAALRQTRAAPRLERLVRDACELQGLPAALFRSLMPFFLLVFLFLKRGYGAPVQARLGALLRHVASSGEPGEPANVKLGRVEVR